MSASARCTRAASRSFRLSKTNSWPALRASMTGISAWRYMLLELRPRRLVLDAPDDALRLVELRAHLAHVGHQHPGVGGAADALLGLARPVALRALIRERRRREQVGPHFAVARRAGRPARRRRRQQLVVLALLERDERARVAAAAGLRQIHAVDRARGTGRRQHVLVSQKLLEGRGDCRHDTCRSRHCVASAARNPSPADAEERSRSSWDLWPC